MAAQPQRGFVRTALGDLHYRRIGSGDPIVLLPPGGRSCAVYAELMQTLSRKYCAIGLDPPGCGCSDRLPAGSTMEDMARSLNEALHQLRAAGACVFGMHSGNKLATALATIPEAGVRKLSIAGLSHSLVPDPVVRHEFVRRHVPEMSPEALRDRVELRAWIAKYSEVTSLWFNQAALAKLNAVEASIGRLEVLIDHIQCMGSKLRLYEANLNYAFEKDLASVRVPTLILEMVTPEEEKLIGRQGPCLQAILPDSRWVALEEADLLRHTFEHRALEIGDILLDFLG
jgi:pimeloyl-ACP methyl ester carboxylesterase